MCSYAPFPPFLFFLFRITPFPPFPLFSSFVATDFDPCLPTMLIKLLHLQVSVENLTINPSDLQTTFKNCKQVEFKKLLIRNWSFHNLDTTLKVIKDFIKENKKF